MEHNPINAALASLNDAFTITTAAIDTSKDNPSAVYRLAPDAGLAILDLINAVLNEREAADVAAMKRSVDDATYERVPVDPEFFRIKPKPHPRHSLTESIDMDDFRKAPPPSPVSMSILDELQVAFCRIITDLRQLRESDGETADYFASVAKMCRLAADLDSRDDLSTALAPTREERPHGR